MLRTLRGITMSEHPELDELQAEYKNAVEAWIAAIRKELGAMLAGLERQLRAFIQLPFRSLDLVPPV